MAIKILALQPDDAVEVPSQTTDVQLIASGSHSLLVLFNKRTEGNQNNILTRFRGNTFHIYLPLLLLDIFVCHTVLWCC